jgi:hypothetical protein
MFTCYEGQLKQGEEPSGPQEGQWQDEKGPYVSTLGPLHYWWVGSSESASGIGGLSGPTWRRVGCELAGD